MKKANAKAFYLACFALFSGNCLAASKGSAINSRPDVCAFEPKAQVSDACASYADLDTLNDGLYDRIHDLASNTDFFSYYRLNLYNKKCPFWNDESGLCGNIACAVTTVDNEADVPEIWRAEELSRLQGPKAQHPGKKQQKERSTPLLGELGEQVGESCVVEYDDECDERDYCIPEDETSGGKGDYVSLVDNPERFTGYGGESAHQIWEAIYRENCFSRPQAAKGVPMQGKPVFSKFSSNQAAAANDLKQVLKAHDRKQGPATSLDAPELEDECLEKRVFYRIVSGMHSSISVHLCDQYLNQTTGQWGPNLQCYKERLHDHPERISNLYFNYALVLRAVGKLKDYVQDYTFCTGDTEQDVKTRSMISELAKAIPAGPQIFDESVMFQDNTLSGVELKEDFRHRFRNISKMMDCVGCDKCRLWGKVQTNGFGTALKVLFEFGNGKPAIAAGHEVPLLRRTELVALINLLDKISAALKAVERFRNMMVDELESPQRRQTASSAPIELDNLAQPPYRQNNVGDAFWEELNTVWSAVVFVLHSWTEVPSKLGAALRNEGDRIFAYWIGLPVPGRIWQFRLPTREEL